jgi:acylphosphatase
VIRRRLVVTGRVVHPTFKEAYVREAGRLGVRGWALSRSDEQVDAVFEGEPAAVEQMIEWTRTGPAHAYVTSVQVVDEEPTGETGFSCR